MKRWRSLNRRGVTLVELMVVMVMMGLVATSMFSVYRSTGSSSRSEDEVVELQQILRTAIDKIADDIHMAGFVVSSDFAPFMLAKTVDSYWGSAVSPYPAAPAAPVTTMHLMMRTASAQAQVIRINQDSPAGADPRSFTGISADQLQLFNTSGDFARVYRAANSDQPLVAVYSVGVSPTTGTPTTLTLTPTTGSLAAVDFKRGDLIARVYAWTPASTQPEYVAYSTLPIATMPYRAAGSAGPALDAAIAVIRYTGACKTDVCFPHVNNTNVLTGGSSQVTSSIGTQAKTDGTVVNSDTNIPRVTRLTFSYLLRDGSEVSEVVDNNRGTTATSGLRNISAVRVTISGQTPSGRRRELSTVVRLLNRGYEAVRE